MSLYDKASLVMIPSGYKDDKLYSIKPTSGDGDFTFSRDGSGASPATRVNSAGLIEKGRSNDFLQSNTFSSSSWAKNNSSVTGGQSGYDGSSDAWLLTEDSATAEHRLRQNPSFGGVCTISVYAKANTRDWLWLRGVLSGVNVRAWFNLSTGTLGSTDGSVIDHNIESVGNGWYKCSMTLNHTSAFENYIGISNADLTTSYAGNGTGSIYIQDAQLEKGLVATSYIETTTAAASAGILGDMPRLDYSGGASCPSLLLEPSRTNVQPHSEYFGSFTNTEDTTLTPNATTSPEGVANAYEVTPQATSNFHRIVADVFTTTSGVDTTISMYVKPNGYNYLLLRTATGTNDNVAFDFTDGSISYEESGYTGFIEDAGNGWYRVGYTKNFSITSPNVYIRFQPTATTNSSISQFTGDGTSGGYVYGFQAEVGSYATSYIPTYGSATARAVDSCIKTGISSLLNPSEGTIFLEINTPDNNTASKVFTIGDGTTNRIQVFYYEDSIRLNFIAGGTTYAYFNHALTDVNDTIKVAVGYAANDIVLYVNGVLTNSDTGATMPSTLVYARFDNGSGGAAFIGDVKQALVFKTRLTNAELASLTTL